MIIGVPKEIKEEEYRVALLPSTAKELVKKGHQVLIEKNAGVGSGISDEGYQSAGAEILTTPEEIFKKAELIVKVKEPQKEEYPLLWEGQIIFTFFHFAAARKLTEAMIKRKIVALAYETVQKDDGSLPLLIPMSEIAGKLASRRERNIWRNHPEEREFFWGGFPMLPQAMC